MKFLFVIILIKSSMSRAKFGGRYENQIDTITKYRKKVYNQTTEL